MTSQIIHKGRYLNLWQRDFHEYVSRKKSNGVVIIVATRRDVDDEGKIKVILVEQHRNALDRSIIELPAGVSGDLDDADEPLSVAAARELEEETGYRAKKMRWLYDCPSSAGLTDEVITFFLALDIEKVGKGGGVEADGEHIIVHEVPIIDVNRWLGEQTRRGAMVASTVWSGLYLRTAHLSNNPMDQDLQ